ncbi:type VI secretion protein IcmF/TssM N-terminal domain-containing protein, partial [Photobacterium sanctipauli]
MNQLIHRLPVWSSLSVIIGMLFIGYVLPWISIAGVPVFRSIWVRIALGLVLLVLVAFVHWYKKRKENQREQALINDMGQVSAGKLTPDSEFNRIFSEVFTALNMEKDGKKRLYEIPWYLVIGSPGSGKTTLLRKSGLDFIGSKEALEEKGIAGTVLCDWWVSSEIVLLDTAGRLTSHDHQEKDASDWSSLLSKLYKYRPIQPLNGIILTLSVDTLMSSEKCDKFIQLAIKRLDDVQKTLNVRLPVYLFITKTDLLPGFDACFHQFESKERRRLWGFPFDQSNSNFKELLQRLKVWVYSKQSELRQDEAQQVLIFYQHFVELTHSISNFTTYLAAELKYDIKLRSVFFTSGTQNGNPVEKIFSQVLSSQYGYSLSDVSLRQYPKAYFIQTAFSDVIYKEAGFAGHAIEYLKKKRMQLILVSSLCFSLLIGMNVYWWNEANKVKITAEEFQDKFDLIAYDKRKLSTIEGSIGFFKDVDSLLEEYSENNFNTLFIDGDIREALYHAKKGVYISTLIPFLINKIRASM